MLKSIKNGQQSIKNIQNQSKISKPIKIFDQIDQISNSLSKIA